MVGSWDNIVNNLHIQLQVNLEHLANWEEKQMFKECVKYIGFDLTFVSLWHPFICI